jgi:uncharacterized protein with FMN-binding domain
VLSVRRAAAAIIGTIAGTTLLVGAKLGAVTPQDAASSTTADLSADPAAANGGAPGPSGGTGTSSSPGGAVPSGVPGKSPATGATTPGTTKTTTAPATGQTTPASTGLKDGTYKGPGVAERYGTITVTITVSGGKISNVSATCGGCNSESQGISTDAFDKLRPKVLAAQSANVSSVSGATYTSGAYKSSLQSAINAAKG